jgi:hypothetical protein
MSTTLDRIPAGLINADLEIPDWSSIRAQLDARARSLDGQGLHRIHG